MILSSYIHQQLAAAHRRDLLEAAEQSRLIAQARQRRSKRQRLPLPFRGPATRRGTIVEPRASDPQQPLPMHRPASAPTEPW